MEDVVVVVCGERVRLEVMKGGVWEVKTGLLFLGATKRGTDIFSS